MFLKRFMCVFLVLVLLLFSACTGDAPEAQNGSITVAASFYPVYIFTLNLVNGIEEINVECMAEQTVGCLHDYSLTAKDARLLSDAEILVINGAGMESFLEDAFESVENLKVVDSSENIEVICNVDHHEEEHNHTHHHENSHIWLSVNNAKLQVENIKNGLVAEFPEYEENIEGNYEDYIARLDALIEKRNMAIMGEKKATAISFHGAFEYLAADLGFGIAETIESSEGAEPSAKELAHLVSEIKEKNIKILLIEPDYSGSAAGILSRETDAEIYTLNPMISGDITLTAYEDIMEENYNSILRVVE